MGILGILQDSAGILGDSRGFSGFLEKVYEVSEVSSPSIYWIWITDQAFHFVLEGPAKTPANSYESHDKCIREIRKTNCNAL